MSRVIPSRSPARLLLLIAGSCASEDATSDVAETDRRVTLDNRGAVCLRQQGDAVTIRVVFDTCLSPGCESVENETCDVSTSAGRIDVVSHAEPVTTAVAGDICADICERASALCAVISAEIGRYEVAHGSAVEEIALPLEKPMQLFADEQERLCDGIEW